MTATGHPVMNRDKQSDRFSAKSGTAYSKVGRNSDLQFR